MARRWVTSRHLCPSRIGASTVRRDETATATTYNLAASGKDLVVVVDEQPGNEGRTTAHDRAVRAAVTLRWLITRLDKMPDRDLPAVCGRLTHALSVNLSRVTRLAESIVVLTERAAPYGDAAVVLARTIWEVLVTSEYLVQDPSPNVRADLAFRYLSHGYVTSYASITAMSAASRQAAGITADQVAGVTSSYRRLREYLVSQGLKRGLTRRVAAREADVTLKEWARHHEWSGLTIEEMAETVARRDEYLQTYAFLSQFAHAGSEAARDYLSAVSGTMELVVDPDEDRRLAIIACWVATTRLIRLYEILVATTSHEPWRSRVERVGLAVRKQWETHIMEHPAA